MSVSIVHIIPRDFRAADDGGRVKTAAIASALARCGELHVVNTDRAPYAGLGHPWGAEQTLPFGGSARFYSCMALPAPLSPLRKAGRKLIQPFTYKSRRWRRAWAGEMAALLAPDIVVADDINCVTAALAVPQARRYVHLHNIESALHRERAAALGEPGVLKRAEEYAAIERSLLPRFDEVWGVREEDLAYFRTLGIGALRLAPNVMAEAAFESSPQVGVAGTGLFFSSLWWEPNADAARELLGVAERLAAHKLRLQIAGRGADAGLQAAMQAAAGVEALGFVPDLKALAAQAAAIVIPITWGGGTKVKTLEAMALGKPIVTTPEGAEGIDLVDGEHALIRAMGPGFDAAVLEVLTAPGRYAEMGLRAQALARARYSQATLDAIVRTALRL